MPENTGGNLAVLQSHLGANSGALMCESEAVDLRFRSEHRLHAAAEFSLVFSARRVLRGKFFDLHYRALDRTDAIENASVSPTEMNILENPADNTSNPSTRIGLVVAKKFARRSVHRNLLKRLAREVFRHLHNRLPPCDVILRLARPTSLQLDAEMRVAVRADLEQLFARLSSRYT